MMTPSVTVAIPCYNGAAFVGPVIESVLAQTRPAEDILVIDDGSSDDSTAIIKQYPVRLVTHEHNRGLAQARNTAIAEAQGDILVFIDVDAMADPHLIEILLSGYDAPDIAGVGGQGIEVNIHSLADRWRRAHATQGHGPSARTNVEHLCGLCMSYRRPVLQQVKGFNTAFRTNAEDVEIGLRLRAQGYRLRYLPAAKVYHQRTDNDASLRRTIANWYAAGYRAKHLNQSHPWTLFVGTCRRLIADPLHDLLVERDAALARLSWQMGWVKLRALNEARRGVVNQ